MSPDEDTPSVHGLRQLVAGVAHTAAKRREVWGRLMRAQLAEDRVLMDYTLGYTLAAPEARREAKQTVLALREEWLVWVEVAEAAQHEYERLAHLVWIDNIERANRANDALVLVTERLGR